MKRLILVCLMFVAGCETQESRLASKEAANPPRFKEVDKFIFRYRDYDASPIYASVLVDTETGVKYMRVWEGHSPTITRLWDE